MHTQYCAHVSRFTLTGPAVLVTEHRGRGLA